MNFYSGITRYHQQLISVTGGRSFIEAHLLGRHVGAAWNLRHPLAHDEQLGWMCLRHGGCWLARLVRKLSTSEARP